jgi:hypothetical protein
MDSIVTYQTVLAIIWFLIGFGLGFAVLRFWKLLLAVVTQLPVKGALIEIDFIAYSGR